MPTTTQSIEEKAVEVFESSIRESVQANLLRTLAMRAMFRNHGFTVVDDSGAEPEERLDNEALKEKILTIISPLRVVTKNDRDTVPMERYPLTGLILDQVPVPPSEEWDALDAMERAAWIKAEQHVWKLIQTKPSDTIQRWVHERLGDGLVVVKTDSEVFLTAEPKYIRSEILLPIADKHEIAAAAMGDLFGAYSAQNPALKASALALLKSSTKRMGEKASASFLLKSAEDGDASNGDAPTGE
jgi:hypothetical protein